MNNDFSLYDLCVGQKCIISRLDNKGVIRRRLMDVGIVPGSIIECLLSSPSGNPMLYLVKDSLIALRNEDASLIRCDMI